MTTQKVKTQSGSEYHQRDDSLQPRGSSKTFGIIAPKSTPTEPDRTTFRVFTDTEITKIFTDVDKDATDDLVGEFDAFANRTFLSSLGTSLPTSIQKGSQNIPILSVKRVQALVKRAEKVGLTSQKSISTEDAQMIKFFVESKLVERFL